MLTSFIRKRLEAYVRRYFEKHPDIRLVAIVGSTDKAMTRQAVGTVLARQFRVRLHEHHKGNSEFATPLAILGIEMPENPHNPLAWLAVFRAARARIANNPDVDVIVQELTVRKPGDMQRFASYLKPSIAIITSVSAERLDVFGSVEEVAKEYLAVGDMADLVIVNRDEVDSAYAEYEHNANITTYGTSEVAEYWLETDDIYSHMGTPVEVYGPEIPGSLSLRVHLLGSHSLLSAVSAVVVATKMGMSLEAIRDGLESVQTLPGRMNPLRGLSETLIIDDTYRAHPENAIHALTTLYEFDAAPQRIAVLSSIPDLGEHSQAEHARVGDMCSPDLLAWVIVVGEDAEKYLAPAARAKGCQVKVCRDAIEAAEFVRTVTERGAIILVEGASPATYLEETTRILCESSEESKLVRQGPIWRTQKDEVFSRFK